MKKFKVSILLASILTAGVGVFAIAAMPVDVYYRASVPGATNPSAACDVVISSVNCRTTGTVRCTVTINQFSYVVSMIPNGQGCIRLYKP